MADPTLRDCIRRSRTTADRLAAADGSVRAMPRVMRLVPTTWLATTLFSLTTFACSSSGDDFAEDAEDGFVVDDNKADNFLSLKAKEFIVTGTTTVTVEPGKGIDRAKQLVFEKHVAITWFLNAYLVDKDHERGDADPNANYGGFSAMVKNG